MGSTGPNWVVLDFILCNAVIIWWKYHPFNNCIHSNIWSILSNYIPFTLVKCFETKIYSWLVKLLIFLTFFKFIILKSGNLFLRLFSIALLIHENIYGFASNFTRRMICNQKTLILHNAMYNFSQTSTKSLCFFLIFMLLEVLLWIF